MNKGNIAVFITSWDHDVWKQILSGIQKKAMEKEYSISIFNCAGSIDVSRKFDVGEFQIFNLANLDMFDGAIIVANTIISKEIENKLFKKIKKSHLPAISLEIKEDEILFAGIDNYSAMREMISHLVEFHQYKNIGFVTGPEKNQESMLRLKAYQDVLKEHGMPVLEENIFKGTYEFKSGTDAAQYFVEHFNQLPDAIACSNDAMAMGLIRGLEARGIRVPKDIAVTGFDDVAAAVSFEPRLSSVSRPKVDLGHDACEILIDKIEKKDVACEVVCPTKAIFRESCGCWVRGGKSYKEFRREYFLEQEINISNSALLNEMSEKLMDCDTFDDFLRNLKGFIPYLNCERLYICTNPEVQGQPFGIDSPDFMGQMKTYESEGSSDYAKKMEVLAGYKDGKYFMVKPFPTKQLLPANEDRNLTKTYLLTPLHFQDRCLGYLIIVNPDLEMNGQPFYQWLMLMNNAVENIRRKDVMNDAMRRLEEMYIRDGLTNLYNRFGFERYSKELYENSKSLKLPMLILFADLNKL